MKTKAKTQAIRPLVETDQMLTEDDVKLLDRLERAKWKVKVLQDHLKPRMSATIEAHGAGRLMVGRLNSSGRSGIRSRGSRSAIVWWARQQSCRCRTALPNPTTSIRTR